VTDTAFPLDTLIGVPRQTVPETADEIQAHQFEQPGWGKLFGAAFRTENNVGSMIAREDMPDPFRKQDGFDWNARYGALSPEVRYEHGHKFVDLHNDRAFEAEAARIDREMKDRRDLEAGGWRGTVAVMAAGILDLPTLIPVGGEYLAAAKGIRGIGLAAARFGAENAAAQAVQEVGLQATQETRTATESAVNVGAGAILGVMLGAGGAALLTRGEHMAGAETV